MGGVGSYLATNDNSGLKEVKCIKIPRVTVRNRFINGDYIILAINKGHLKKKFSNKKIGLGLVSSIKRQTRRASGYYVAFGENRVVLFANPEKTIGTRLYGPISFETRLANSTKLIKFARGIL